MPSDNKRVTVRLTDEELAILAEIVAATNCGSRNQAIKSLIVNFGKAYVETVKRGIDGLSNSTSSVSAPSTQEVITPDPVKSDPAPPTQDANIPGGFNLRSKLMGLRPEMD